MVIGVAELHSGEQTSLHLLTFPQELRDQILQEALQKSDAVLLGEVLIERNDTYDKTGEFTDYGDAAI